MNIDNSARVVIPSTVQGETVLATGPYAITLHNKGFYGVPERDGLRLNGFEALHLFELGRIKIDDADKNIDEHYLTTYYSSIIDNFILRYLVYKDLRNRGYILNLGMGSSFFFRLYDRNAKPKQDGAKYYVTPLQEGGSILLKDLEDLVEIAKKSKKILLFGYVDAVGDVSYLKVNQLRPEVLENKIFSDFHSWNWEKLYTKVDSWEKSIKE